MILVTGGTGLVGTHLIYDLLMKGEKVRAIRRANSKVQKLEKVISYYHSNPKELMKNLEWVEADILDISSIEKAMDKIEQVYHCAAIISFDPADHLNMIKNNTDGTANLVNISLEKKVKKFCHVSSIAAVGRDNTQNVVSENDQWVYSKEQSAYAISKYESEREVWRAMAEGLNVVIINPSIILGPGHWGEGSSKIFDTIWNGLKFYTDGVTGYVDVRDVSKLMIDLMESDIKNERFIINSENVPYKKLFDMVAEEMKVQAPKYKAGKFLSSIVWRIYRLRYFITKKPPIVTKETARTANKKYYFSNQKIKDHINIEFIPISTSTKDTIKYFLSEQ